MRGKSQTESPETQKCKTKLRTKKVGGYLQTWMFLEPYAQEGRHDEK